MMRSMRAGVAMVWMAMLAACGGEHSSSQSGSGEQVLTQGDAAAQREFEDALANPAYSTLQGKDGSFRVRIGVVRAEEIPAARGSSAKVPLTPAHKAFLDVIAAAEGTSRADRCGDRGGYNVAFTGVCFSSFETHPGVIRGSRNGYSSDAHGRYQFLSTTWGGFVGFLKNLIQLDLGGMLTRLEPFGPRGQDAAAAVLIKHKRGDTPAWQVIANIKPGPNGRFDHQVQSFEAFRTALHHLAPEWASLPLRNGRSYYGQPVYLSGHLWEVFKDAYPLYAYPRSGDQMDPAEGVAGEGGKPFNGTEVASSLPPHRASGPEVNFE